MDPIKLWTGRFGNEYTDRNEFANWKVKNAEEVFRRILGKLKPRSVLEVGSNIGLNLLAIDRLFEGRVQLYAAEPNLKSFERLTENRRLRLKGAWNCSAYNIPLPDSSVDLVFTCGVLIHIPPKRLAEATREIVRVARRYVLCVEYFSHTPQALEYRGQKGLLFKRDFGGFYLDMFRELKPKSYGFVWQREFRNFDNLNWWLFERSRQR